MVDSDETKNNSDHKLDVGSYVGILGSEKRPQDEVEESKPEPPHKHIGAIPEEKSRPLEIEKDDTFRSNESVESSQFIRSFTADWWFSILIGFLVVSFWRGTWVLLDIWTCSQDGDAGMVNGESFCFAAEIEDNTGFVSERRHTSAWITYLAGNILFIIGITLLFFRLWTPRKGALGRVSPKRTIIRIFIVYVLGWATVNIWHGVWYFIDHYFMSRYAIESWWGSTCIGAAVCYLMLAGNSLLAPPAIFLLDGPTFVPPPIGVTILSSYKSITTPVNELDKEKTNFALAVLDTIISYFWLPWPVVGFWRGFWYLMDEYLYGFTPEVKDLHFSILYSILIALGCLFIASEDIVQLVPGPTSCGLRIFNEIFIRVRTLILAIGTVNFWRAVWLMWDEFLGRTTNWSAAISHIIGVLGLLALGCMSCITAPPSTLGVDAIADPDCADEPLFSNVPIPAELLYAFSIGRQVETTNKLLPNIKIQGDVVSPDFESIHESCSSRRVYQQSGSHVLRETRSESITSCRLSSRQSSKRENSQFYRSR